MAILGIVGGTNVGKSTICTLFKSQNIRTKMGLEHIKCHFFDADTALKALYDTDKNVISRIQNAYPEVIQNDKIDRKKLASFYFRSDQDAEQIEAASYNEIVERIKSFIRHTPKNDLGIMDIPLLIKLNMHIYCDICLMIITDYNIRKKRAIKRFLSQRHWDKAFAITFFNKIVKKQACLTTNQYADFTAQKAAILGDKLKINALEKDNTPYYILDNTTLSQEEIIDMIANKVIKYLF